MMTKSICQSMTNRNFKIRIDYFKIEANSSNPPSFQMRRHITCHGLGSTENIYEDRRSRSSSMSQSRSRSDSVSSEMQTTSELPSVDIISARQLLTISPAQISQYENQFDFTDENIRSDVDVFYDRNMPKENRSTHALSR